jgi:hypothetical protein
MPKFQATVRVSDLEGADPAAAQHLLDERLKGAGFENWQVLSIETPGAVRRRERREIRPVARRRSQSDGWGLFFVAAGAWVVWFLWALAD